MSDVSDVDGSYLQHFVPDLIELRVKNVISLP